MVDKKSTLKKKTISNFLKVISFHAKWERKNFLDEPNLDIKVRENSEDEVNYDFRKPIQQLVCDVHEEIEQVTREPDGSHRESSNDEIYLTLQNLNHALKRFASLAGRVSIANERSSFYMAFFTIVLLIISIFTFCMQCNQKESNNKAVIIVSELNDSIVSLKDSLNQLTNAQKITKNEMNNKIDSLRIEQDNILKS